MFHNIVKKYKNFDYNDFFKNLKDTEIKICPILNF
jgi:hypothetical protein